MKKQIFLAIYVKHLIQNTRRTVYIEKIFICLKALTTLFLNLDELHIEQAKQEKERIVFCYLIYISAIPLHAIFHQGCPLSL